MEKIIAKKSLGQNFLKDENVLQKIANTFEVSSHDLIVEIGPGKGALTKYLVQKSCDLICYEIDERMKDILDSFQSERVQIIFDDFLKRDLAADIKKNYTHIYVIANIPYYITTPIIEHLLTSSLLISGMTLLVQKEVAMRFSALPGTREYGYFTVLLQHFFEIEKIFDVSPSSFSPPPKVMSSVVRFIRKKEIISLHIFSFSSFLKKAFAFKRKTLKNNLKDYDWESISFVLEKNHFSLNVRAEEIPYEVFVEIFKKLNN